MLVRAAVFVCAVFAATVIAAADTANDDQIRVGLSYGPSAPESVVISGTGVHDGERSQGDFEGDVTVLARAREVVFDHAGQQIQAGRWVEFWPTGRDPWLEVGRATYRGRIRIEPAEGGRLRIINTVGIEDYVRGVVANEMFSDGAACKAQAVVSRTYAIYVRDIEKKHRQDGFDICATGHCQVYAGLDSERPLADEAVAATRGEILTYQGNPAFAAYHSNAGGMTQTVDEAWPGSIRERYPYLCPVESPYDAEVRNMPGYSWCYRWERQSTPEQIAERLRARGTDIGEVTDLVVKSRTDSGQVKELEIVGSKGSVMLRNPTEVRAALGLPSSRLEIRQNTGGFAITGLGNGHGVGMSQHGALGMSRAGYGYEQILGHYYRGLDLTGDYGLGPSRPLVPPELRLDPITVEPAPLPPGG